MLYKFKSKAGGDVILLEANGQEILRIIGKEVSPNGILLPEHMPSALHMLETAIHAQETSAQAGESPSENDASAANPIRLRQRAWPLIALIQASFSMQTPVVWGV
jgi:Domain of unknown function (DUF1840)